MSTYNEFRAMALDPAVAPEPGLTRRKGRPPADPALRDRQKELNTETPNAERMQRRQSLHSLYSSYFAALNQLVFVLLSLASSAATATAGSG